MAFKLRPGENVNLPLTGSERHYRINPDNSQTTIATGNPLIARDVSHVQGYDVEGYHKLKREGHLIPLTPWYKYSSRMSWTARLHYSQPSVPYNWKTDANWSHPISLTPYDILEAAMVSIADSKDTTRYVQAAAASIYSSKFDALTFLAEFHKTVGMFQNAVSQLARLAITYRKAKKGLVDPAQTLGNLYLEYRYGWRILYYDMVDISDALANLGLKRERFSQRTGAKSNSSTSTNYQYNGPAYQFTVNMIEELKISLRGTVVADIEPPNFAFNPLTTSWELIPFSFIVDWFIGIGTWLETLSFMFLQTSHVAAGGIDISLKRSMVLTNKTASAGYSIVIMEAQCVSEALLRMRNPQSVSNFPLVRVNLDVPKVFDLLAIYNSLFGREANPDFRKRTRI